MNRTYPHSRPLIQILTLSCVLLLGSGRVLAETGLGVVLGWPAGIRYQQSLDIKRALFFDFAYQGDGYVIGSGHYSYSLFREEDRWRQDPRMGTLLYNIFAGITAGYRVETSREQKSLLGVKGGGALEYLFPHKRWSVRAEVAPVLFYLAPRQQDCKGELC